MSKKKRVGLFAAIAVLAAVIVAAPAVFRSASANAAETAAKSPMQVVSMLYREWGGGMQWRIAAKFDVSVGAAGEDLAEQKSKVRINGILLSDVADATCKVSANDSTEVHIIFSKDAAVGGTTVFSDTFDGNRVTLLEGFTGSRNYTLNEAFYFYFGKGALRGTRVYRSDNPDDYATVKVSSVAVPKTESNNTIVDVFMSDTIGDRQMHDMQPRELRWMKELLKDYTARELDLYYKYGIIGGNDQPESTAHKIEYGCSSWGLREQYPGNKTQLSMEPKDTVEGIPVYSVYQIQDTVPDDGQQPLVVQVHFENNRLRISFKGDADDNRYNIAPEKDEKMVLRLKAGFMFTSGNMLKEDETFVFEPESGMWRQAGVTVPERPADVTLANQNGLTDEELAGGGKGGCGSAVAAGYLPTALMLFGGAVILLRRKAKGENRA